MHGTRLIVDLLMAPTSMMAPTTASMIRSHEQRAPGGISQQCSLNPEDTGNRQQQVVAARLYMALELALERFCGGRSKLVGDVNELTLSKA
jgi:hypothetical protein